MNQQVEIHDINHHNLWYKLQPVECTKTIIHNVDNDFVPIVEHGMLKLNVERSPDHSNGSNFKKIDKSVSEWPTLSDNLIGTIFRELSSNELLIVTERFNSDIDGIWYQTFMTEQQKYKNISHNLLSYKVYIKEYVIEQTNAEQSPSAGDSNAYSS